eukprot:CAMPEP_0183719106 /NCGR_PEP_ID=MMETSP0737-20130205/12188_1 /TAXON_ID=385413 /ORGANISM="Thalassiosira miniscula, Strain CCMP1093" /LENGTH=215 /DNA_ID=CAMNT_0025948807 /DNA_START=329 /DNA_END=976 /DNA_ORIENTATION=+
MNDNQNLNAASSHVDDASIDIIQRIKLPEKSKRQTFAPWASQPKRIPDLTSFKSFDASLSSSTVVISDHTSNKNYDEPSIKRPVCLSSSKADRTRQTSPEPELASSSATLSSTAASTLATRDTLSEASSRSSIKRSFDLLNNIDLSVKRTRYDLSITFFWESEMYPNEWTQEGTDSLVDLANDIILGKYEKKRRTVGGDETMGTPVMKRMIVSLK